jgi:hypothetical protein
MQIRRILTRSQKNHKIQICNQSGTTLRIMASKKSNLISRMLYFFAEDEDPDLGDFSELQEHNGSDMTQPVTLEEQSQLEEQSEYPQSIPADLGVSIMRNNPLYTMTFLMLL